MKTGPSEEKERVATAHIFDSKKVKLDVGGQIFTTSQSTLTSYPHSILGSMFSGGHPSCQQS